MMATSTLEKRLLDYWRGLETLKTWSEWVAWFAAFEDAFTLGDVGVGATVKINYLKFLSLWEHQLESHSSSVSQEWKKKLTDPRWLQKQKIIVLPSSWFEDTERHPTEGRPTELESLRDQVVQLSTELNQLRQQVMTLEDKWGMLRQNIDQQGSSTSLTTERRNIEGSSTRPHSLENNLGTGDKKESDEWGKLRSSQMLGPTIVKKQSGDVLPKNNKPTSKENEDQSPKIKPLEEIYLPFSEWIEQFKKDGFRLQELISSTVQKDGRSSHGTSLESSRPISFQQFQRRASRYIERTDQFEEIVHVFTESYVQGFPMSDKESQSPTEEMVQDEMGTTQEKLGETQSFEKPADDVYLGFNDWIAWLKDHDIDPQNFTSNELKGSSRRISYTQFCKRLERQLDDVEAFQKVLQLAERS